MRKLITAVVALTVLAGCTSQASVPTPTSTTQALLASPQPSPEEAKPVSFTSSSMASKPSPAPQIQFNFPQASCGDKPSQSSETWYPVFVERGDLATIRRNFCADAVSTVRKDTGVQAVQLSSFTSRDKALEFAQAVGGDVGQPTDANAETDTSTSVASAEAVLTADDPDSQINLRKAPSTNGKSLGYGLVGDRLQIIEQTTADGYTWHKVKFPRSGAIGWIRGDFALVDSQSQTSQPSSEPETDYSAPTTTYYSQTVSSSGGNCNSPSDLDARGHRCGGRASSVRSGGGGRRRR